MRCGRVISRTRCRSSLHARCRTCATGSSRCNAASCTRCARWGSIPGSSIASAPASSARFSRAIIRTVIRRSTTRWCAWRKILRCAIRWSTAMATSARSIPIRRQRTATRSRGWRGSRSRCWRTSTKRPSISFPTSTTKPKSRSCCRRACRNCSSTGRAASRSAWRPTSRRTTSARFAMRSCCWRTTRTRATMRCSRSSKGRIFRPAASCTAARRSVRPI